MARGLRYLPALQTAALLSLLGGCGSLLPGDDGNVYEMQRSAVLAYESGADARAEALYRGLSRSAPNDPETWLRLGNLYARSNRADDAADAYRQGLLLAPGDYRLWYNLGIIRQRQAQASFIQAHQLLQPDNPLYAKSQALVDRLAQPAADAATPTSQ